MAEDIRNLAEDYRRVYDDTLYFIDGMTSEYDFYPSILSMLAKGNMSLDLKKRLTIKSIDELWIKTIEESLTALDTAIRNPSRFIEENEKVMNIEVSRNISSRSIKHLSQHTDYINDIRDDGMIIPSKILNVFHDETILTYENKFINTLVERLFAFVVRRYDAIIKNGASEKSTALNFSGSFLHGTVKGKLNFGIEISEEPDISPEALENEKDLRQRIINIYEIVQAYTNSEFIKSMGKNYIKPPVMRTNAILKNKDLRQCLALWEFISGCETAGYQVSIEENAEKIGDDYIKELYSTCALQYLIFRYKISNEFIPDNRINSSSTVEPFLPKFVTAIKPFDPDEYNAFDFRYAKRVYSGVEDEKISSEDAQVLAHEIDLAFAADAMLRQMRKDAEEERRRLQQAIEDAELNGRSKVKLPRKKKKNIRRMAEVKAESVEIELPRVFDYDLYMRFIDGKK